MSTYAKKQLKEVKEKRHQWIFEVHGTYVPGGDSNFIGKLKDEAGKVVIQIKEDQDYNQLSRLFQTSKYMTSVRDMKGLAKWAWDRGLVPMATDEKAKWNKKKIVPLDIKEISV
jgi:hypothetical protein